MSLGSWFWHKVMDAQSAASGASPAATEVQRLFLGRLDRLAGMRDNEHVWEQLSDAGHELLRWSIYSTYCDCVDAGVEPAARRILHPLVGARHEVGLER
ncbi:MAG: hypothetical protein NTZ05_03525 [Chloroflexi bacterium]|nr:hypothetical protein [Chloroflexota bacterium]